MTPRVEARARAAAERAVDEIAARLAAVPGVTVVREDGERATTMAVLGRGLHARRVTEPALRWPGTVS